MAERLPLCPFCETPMEVYERNNSFFICPGGENKKHNKEYLISTKLFQNGKEKEPTVDSNLELFEKKVS